MSLIHPHGPVCAVSELDLHALPITQQDILKSQTTVKTTNNALTAHTQSFDFTFEPTTLYTDLGDTELYLEYKVQKPDGTALAVGDEAAPVNNIGHSLFRSAQFLINGEKVTANNEDYATRAMLLDLLGTNKTEKKGKMAGCQKWEKDTAGHMDTKGAANIGWVARRRKCAAHDTHAVVLRPHLDMLSQCKFLPGHCELKFIFERSSKDFYMMQAADGTFFINITKAEMRVRQVVIRDEVVETHNKMLMDPKFGPFNYAITRTRVTKHTLDGGSLNYSWTQPDTTQVPSRIVLGLVKETSASGTKTENPFSFRHYDVSHVEVKFNDQKFELETHFADGMTQRAYNQLFKDTGIQACGIDCDLTIDEFEKGYTLFAFDLTPDRTPEDNRINLLRQGKLTISLRFRNALPHSVTTIICSFFDNNIQLNSDRLPVTDYYMA